MALQRRSAFGSWDVEKVHGVVARSTFGRQHVNIHTFGQLLEVEMLKKCTPLWREARSEAKPLKKSIEVETLKQCTPLWHDSHLEIKITSGSEHFWKLWCSKSVRRSGGKHISKSKYEKHHVGTAFGSWDVTLLWCEAHFEINMCKAHHVRSTFKGRLCGRRKVSKTWGFPSPCKNDGGRGTFEEGLNYTVLITLYSTAFHHTTTTTKLQLQLQLQLQLYHATNR